MYINTKSLFCTPENSMILYVSYTAIENYYDEIHQFCVLFAEFWHSCTPLMKNRLFPLPQWFPLCPFSVSVSHFCSPFSDFFHCRLVSPVHTNGLIHHIQLHFLISTWLRSMLSKAAIVLYFDYYVLMYAYSTAFHLFCRWTFGLLLVWGYYKYNNYKHSCKNLFWGHTFIFLYQIPVSLITGSQSSISLTL